MKRSHDEYHVYVNGDLVGNKVLLTQVDDVHDVAAYLRRHGFHDFKTNLDGDHYTVEMNEASQVEAVKRQLSTYLQIR